MNKNKLLICSILSSFCIFALNTANAGVGSGIYADAGSGLGNGIYSTSKIDLATSVDWIGEKSDDVDQDKEHYRGMPVVSFPDPKKSYLRQVPTYEYTDIERATYGVSSDNIRKILGNPHFSEFDSRTWNYIVGLRDPRNGEYVTCQVQYKFDKNDLVKFIYWKDMSCPMIVDSEVKADYLFRKSD